VGQFGVVPVSDLPLKRSVSELQRYNIRKYLTSKEFSVLAFQYSILSRWTSNVLFVEAHVREVHHGGPPIIRSTEEPP